MKQKITFLLILNFLIFTSCKGQNSDLTDFTIDKKELKISNFSEIKKVQNFPYGDEEEELREKKLKAYKVLDLKKINFLGIYGTSLYLVAKKDKIQDYWLRVEGIDNVKKLYEKIDSKYPNMTSYNDGTLRFKHFYNDNEVLEITINDLMPSDVFMDILFTNNYKNTSCNMYKHYDQNINRKPKKVNFKYNSETKAYEIERVNEE
ncbi:MULTISPECIES: hypothetical protein [Chitinophagaceae]